jgi:hypothetical protein
MILIKVFRYQSKLKYMVKGGVMKKFMAAILTQMCKLDHFRVVRKKVLYYEKCRACNKKKESSIQFFFLEIYPWL